MSYTITVGKIPESWVQNADAGSNVEIGNPDFSLTPEITIQLDEIDAEGINDSIGTSFTESAILYYAELLVDEIMPEYKNGVIAYHSAAEFVVLPEYLGMVYLHYYDSDADCDRLIVVDPDL